MWIYGNAFCAVGLLGSLACDIFFNASHLIASLCQILNSFLQNLTFSRKVNEKVDEKKS